VQIGDENVHRVRALMDEVFGGGNFVAAINYVTTSGRQDRFIDNISNHIVWFAKNSSQTKYRQLYLDRADYNGDFIADQLQSDGLRKDGDFPILTEGRNFRPKEGNHWKVRRDGAERVAKAGRLIPQKAMVRYKRFGADFSVRAMPSVWLDTSGGAGKDKIYVVQSNARLVERCILMTTDPGDLVLDPTCGSGTTAYVAEQWGRRWITIDTSRVAVALARSRLMGARYPYYLLADSKEGQQKEAEVTQSAPKSNSTFGSIRQGFVYDRVSKITSSLVANNAEIDVIWDRMQPAVEDAIAALNTALHGHPVPFEVETGGRKGAKIDFTATGQVTLPSGEPAPANGFMEWEIPRQAPADWPQPAKAALARFWEARIARQTEIDASIAAKADFEYLYDKPIPDKTKIRVAGPFTVESLSPHRTLAVDWDDELIDLATAAEGKRQAERDGTDDFAHMILENLKAAGVQQAAKEDRITFTALVGWPGRYICAEGTFMEGAVQRRAGIFIGPEFGTVSRPDLVAAAREAGDAGFDMLISCAFNYDAHSAEFDKLGRVPVLKARMNPDLHMGGDLKATGAGNLFVVFGEPDIKIEEAGDGMIRVKVFGVDVFKPQTGEVLSEGTEGIALWMLDTDYNEESFFVRHAYFLGANDPFKALKTTLKAEIDSDAWDSLYSDVSRPFPKPKSGRIAVKVINHLGDEVMKVFAVE
jgi:adenine-specific DNA-methyltransferase